MTRRSTTRADQAASTRQRILETAQRLFAEQSYDAVSLQMIADAMSVTKANVYYYFHTKAEILTAIIEPTLAAMNSLFDAAVAIRSKQRRTQFMIDGYVQELVASRSFATLSTNDPALRRERELNLADQRVRERGLFVLFGDHPTPDQRVAYHLLDALRQSLYLLNGLSDDEACRSLTETCKRILRIPNTRLASHA